MFPRIETGDSDEKYRGIVRIPNYSHLIFCGFSAVLCVRACAAARPGALALGLSIVKESKTVQIELIAMNVSAKRKLSAIPY